MATFKDCNGRTWTVSLDAPTIRTVRKELDGLDLADVEIGKTYERLVDDPCLLVDTLFVLCRQQASANGVSDEQFGRALVGDVIDAATGALLEAIRDFFPKRTRALVTAVAAKNQKVRELGMAKALAKINDPALESQVLAAMEAQMDQAVAAALREMIPSSSATDTPASSESTPRG